MPTDRYTKAVLTVIAGALLYIGAMLSGQPASAQTMAPASQAFVDERQPQPVVIVGWGTVRSDGKVFVNTVRDVGGFSRTDATLPVAVQATRQQPLPVSIQQTAGQPLAVSLGVTTQRPLPVAVHGLKIGADWDPVRTKVDNQPLTRFPGPP
jgi:Ni,Fe-hydrogenase III small subunit